MTKIRTYSELSRLVTFDERFDYLNLEGVVGESTFGFDRWINQRFYTSAEWRSIRREVLLRDNACDLGVDGYEIHTGLLIHHMNPVTKEDLLEGVDRALDPEFLITTNSVTHNAIHYGNKRQLPKIVLAREPGDTNLW